MIIDNVRNRFERFQEGHNDEMESAYVGRLSRFFL